MLTLPAGTEHSLNVVLASCNGVKGRRLCSRGLDAANSNGLQSDVVLCVDAAASRGYSGAAAKELAPMILLVLMSKVAR